jgi:hypothetical protein
MNCVHGLLSPPRQLPSAAPWSLAGNLFAVLESDPSHCFRVEDTQRGDELAVLDAQRLLALTNEQAPHLAHTTSTASQGGAQEPQVGPSLHAPGVASGWPQMAAPQPPMQHLQEHLAMLQHQQRLQAQMHASAQAHLQQASAQAQQREHERHLALQLLQLQQQQQQQRLALLRQQHFAALQQQQQQSLLQAQLPGQWAAAHHALAQQVAAQQVAAQQVAAQQVAAQQVAAQQATAQQAAAQQAAAFAVLLKGAAASESTGAAGRGAVHDLLSRSSMATGQPGLLSQLQSMQAGQTAVSLPPAGFAAELQSRPPMSSDVVERLAPGQRLAAIARPPGPASAGAAEPVEARTFSLGPLGFLVRAAESPARTSKARCHETVCV